MNNRPRATGLDGLPSFERFAAPAARTCLVACVMAIVLAGGCAGGKLTPVKSAADFEHQVLQADKPVLVLFYKAGCPTVVLLEPTLDQLAGEYEGPVTFVKFKIWEWYFGVPSPEIKQRYEIWWAPTVILFAEGQVVNRWVGSYNIDGYRKALNEITGRPAAQEPVLEDEQPGGEP